MVGSICRFGDCFGGGLGDPLEVDGVRLTTDERLEFVRLRREVKELRMEKEILKKASAFFAKEMK